MKSSSETQMMSEDEVISSKARSGHILYIDFEQCIKCHKIWFSNTTEKFLREYVWGENLKDKEAEK